MSELKYLTNFIRALKWEGIALAALMVVLTYKANAPLWFLIAAFLVFDISAIGYLFNNRIGAILYNIGHSTVLPTILLIIGLIVDWRLAVIWSFTWLFHIGVDRALGFGLKDTQSFRHTHLGVIKKKSN